MILAIAIIYFVIIILGAGLITRKKIKSSGDFTNAGGSLGWAMVTCSFVLIPLGSGHSMSLWEQSVGPLGGSTLWWALAAGAIFLPLMMLWLGPLARRTGLKTFPDITKSLFGRGFSWLHACVSIGSMTGLCAAEMIATGVCIFTLSNGAIPMYPWCILIAFAFFLLYVIFGGLLQMAWINIANSIVLIIGSFAGLIGVVIWVGAYYTFGGATGLDAVGAYYQSEGLQEALSQFAIMGDKSVWFNLIIPATLLHLCAATTSQTHNLPFFAARSDADCRKGVFLAAGINTMSAVPWVGIALIAFAIPSVVAAGGNNLAPMIVPLAALQMLPKPLIGLLMVSLLAATLSTGSSICLGNGQLLANQIFKGALKPNMSDQTLLRTTKICVVACSVICLIPALRLPVIMPVFMWCFMLMIPFFFNYLTAMYFAINKPLAWVSLILSYIVAFVWTFAPPNVPYPFGNILYPMLIVGFVFGMFLPMIIGGQPPRLKVLRQQEAAIPRN